jgi:hypothetical protein
MFDLIFGAGDHLFLSNTETRAHTLIWSWITLWSEVFRLFALHIDVNFIIFYCSTSENKHRPVALNGIKSNRPMAYKRLTVYVFQRT